MDIQWFPGHMLKAKKALMELIDDIDLVIEVLDARAPFSSCNPLLQGIIKYKKNIKLLNKSDLADPEITNLWLNFFNSQNNTSTIKGCKDNKNQRNTIIKLCKSLAPHRNRFEKPLRVMISGIPNVGKSTLINQLLNKKTVKTGDIPALTRGVQRLIVDDSFIIYDTPGLTWQKIHHPQIGFNLALCNSIGRNALDEEALAIYLIKYLQQHYLSLLKSRYKLDKLPDLENLEAWQLIEQIAIKRGSILPGNKLDLQKVSELILQDFRDKKIGAISLETPSLWQEADQILTTPL